VNARKVAICRVSRVMEKRVGNEWPDLLRVDLHLNILHLVALGIAPQDMSRAMDTSVKAARSGPQ